MMAVPEGTSEILVPPTVIALPGVSVWEPMVNCVFEGLAVMVVPPTVMTGGTAAAELVWTPAGVETAGGVRMKVIESPPAAPED